MQENGSNGSRTAQACAPRPHGKGAWQGLALAPALALLLGACSPALTPVTPEAQNTPEPAPAVAPSNATMRVIVQFRTPVAYADSTFLQTLGQQANARITYLASVSADTHVYRIEPLGNQRPVDVLQRLSEAPSVLRAEVDALAHPS
jgi:hypothetical protein